MRALALMTLLALLALAGCGADGPPVRPGAPAPEAGADFPLSLEL